MTKKNFDSSDKLVKKAQAAWKHLKKALYSANTLTYSDFDALFVLYTDRLKEREFGAALYQKDANSIERPVLFLSKVLADAEKNYQAIELETAALV